MAKARTHRNITVERLVPAEIEAVWRAITDPDDVQQYFDDNVVESSWMPGEPVLYRDGDGELVIEGTIVDVDEPHRLQHTFSYTARAHADAAGDAPSEVTWTLEPDDDGTHVRLVHAGFDSQNATWRAAEDGWEQVLDGIVELFDDGDLDAE